MPLADLNEERDVRVKALLLGHIRLGIFEGKAPKQTETFVFTSADRQRLEPLATDFGGAIESYRPQGAGTDTWRLVSEADAFTALFPFPEVEGNLTQDWMLWKRSGLERICTGYEATIYTADEETGEREGEDVSCICAAKERRECSPETRLRFLLAQTGLGIWELTTRSKIAALDLHDQVSFIASVAQGHMNHLPVRVVFAPREISYVGDDRKRHTTTKRLVSLSVAGDAEGVLSGLAMRPDRALIAAVRTALSDAGRELVGMSFAPELAPGVEHPPVEGEASTGEAEPEGEDHGLVAPSGEAAANPGLDETATPEQWARAATAGLRASAALKVGRKLFPDAGLRASTDLTKRQLGQVIAAYLDGERG